MLMPFRSPVGMSVAILPGVMGMGVAVLMGMGMGVHQLTVPMGVTVRVAVLMVMLHGHGIPNHQNRRHDHDGQGQIKTARRVSPPTACSVLPPKMELQSKRHWFWPHQCPFGPECKSGCSAHRPQNPAAARKAPI